MSFYKRNIFLFSFLSLIVVGCKPKDKDFIDHSMHEFSKHFKPNNVFMIIECTDQKNIINILVESTKDKTEF